MNVDQLKGCATALLTPFRNGEVELFTFPSRYWFTIGH